MSFIRLIGAGILFLLFKQILKIIGNVGKYQMMDSQAKKNKAKDNAIDVSFVRKE